MNPIKTLFKSALGMLPEKTRHRIMLSRMRRGNEAVIRNWEAAGKPMTPPHSVKQIMIEKYRSLYNCDILVETGTYLGDMIFAQIDRFKSIYSIELSKDLALKAADRFKSYPKVHILQGDSGKQLSSLLVGLNGNVLFWLDGHYSAGITAKGDTDCPVRQELRAILLSGITNPVILIDDAREFTGEHDYPSVIEIKEILKEFNYDHHLEIEDDTIRITPKN